MAVKNVSEKTQPVFFIPLKDFFKLSFIFGDKAVLAVEESDLPQNIKTTLKNAKKYMEGRGLSIEVKSSKEVEIVKKLVEIKVNN